MLIICVSLSVQQIILQNSGSSLNLSNSNRTASSDLYASFDSRLRKLETSASAESVRDQVTDLDKEVKSLKSDLERVRNDNLRLQEENTQIRKENANLKDTLVSDDVDCTYLLSEHFLSFPVHLPRPSHSDREDA